MNKKGQWARAAARERKTQERTLRKTYARALQLLGFSINEIVDFLNVSTQTVKTYLKETEGFVYSDLAEQAYKPNIFSLFTKKEQELLSKFKELSSMSKSLSNEAEQKHKIVHKKNISGWLVHKFGNVDKHKLRQKEISEEISKIKEEANEILKRFSDKKICPHLSNSSLNFVVKAERSWYCEHCGKKFDTKKTTEKHEVSCVN